MFSIDATSGQLALVQQISTEGSSPRNFVLDPSGKFLLVANQRSNSILSYLIDPSSGRLTPTGQKVEIGAPVCIKFR